MSKPSEADMKLVDKRIIEVCALAGIEPLGWEECTDRNIGFQTATLFGCRTNWIKSPSNLVSKLHFGDGDDPQLDLLVVYAVACVRKMEVDISVVEKPNFKNKTMPLIWFEAKLLLELLGYTVETKNDIPVRLLRDGKQVWEEFGRVEVET